MNNLRYAIIGTGAIGGYYGARLQQGGCEVHFLLRSDYEQVRDRGLKITSVDGDFTLPTVHAHRSPETMPPVDVAIVALKTTANDQIASLLPALRPGGAILCLQNGFGVERAIAQTLSAAGLNVPAILGGLCFICSNKTGPGEIHHLDYGRIVIGEHTESEQPSAPSPLMEQIATDFEQANLPLKLTDDLPMARWQKLVWNVPYNGLSVVLNASTEEMMADRGVRSLITDLMREVVAVANAWSAAKSPGSQRRTDKGIIDTMLQQTEQMPPYRTSMKIDYDEGRSLELAFILANPIDAAAAAGVEVPLMRMLYKQLSFLNARRTHLTET